MFDNYMLVLIQKKNTESISLLILPTLLDGVGNPKTSVLTVMTSGCLLLFVHKLS